MYKPLTAPYWFSVEQCEQLNSGEAYLKYPSDLDGQSKVGMGVFTLVAEPTSSLVMQGVHSNYNSSEVAKVRLMQKRKAKKAMQNAIKRKDKIAKDLDERREHRKVGDILMVKVLTSLAPANYKGRTVHLIPQGITVPAIRTLRGVKLLLSEGRSYECFKHWNEYGELIGRAVSLTVLQHKAVKGLGIKSKAVA